MWRLFFSALCIREGADWQWEQQWASTGVDSIPWQQDFNSNLKQISNFSPQKIHTSMAGRHCETRKKTNNLHKEILWILWTEQENMFLQLWNVNPFWGHTAKDKLLEIAKKQAKSTAKIYSFLPLPFLLDWDEPSFSAYWQTSMDCSHLGTAGCSTLICNTFQTYLIPIFPFISFNTVAKGW